MPDINILITGRHIMPPVWETPICERFFMAPAISNPATASQLDVVFEGTWIFLLKADASQNIIGVDVYSPSCGHPHAALFLPQLGPFTPQTFPPFSSFYMIDSHGLTLAIERPAGGMPSSGIDRTINHSIAKPRPLGGNWDVVLSINAGPDLWVSSGTQLPVATDPSSGKTVPCFSGADAPAGKISTIQTLSFKGVTSVNLCGAPSAVQSQIPSPYAGNGSLLFEGEVPYIPSLQHERAAINAMAALAGLDLLLEHPLPSSGSAAPNPVMRPRVAGSLNCGHSLFVGP
jgi:hypothetical protein